jgi:hypothetical protein
MPILLGTESFIHSHKHMHTCLDRNNTTKRGNKEIEKNRLSRLRSFTEAFAEVQQSCGRSERLKCIDVHCKHVQTR